MTTRPRTFISWLRGLLDDLLWTIEYARLDIPADYRLPDLDSTPEEVRKWMGYVEQWRNEESQVELRAAYDESLSYGEWLLERLGEAASQERAGT